MLTIKDDTFNKEKIKSQVSNKWKVERITLLGVPYIKVSSRFGDLSIYAKSITGVSKRDNVVKISFGGGHALLNDSGFLSVNI